jgi:hypothetical protein
VSLAAACMRLSCRLPSFCCAAPVFCDDDAKVAEAAGLTEAAVVPCRSRPAQIQMPGRGPSVMCSRWGRCREVGPGLGDASES